MQEEWKQILKNAITTPEALAKALKIDKREILDVHDQFPLFINPYYLSLIREKNDPIYKQAVPSMDELKIETAEELDPLAEEHDSPVPHITHRYPDRVLFYVNSNCALYCRFCTRKRKVGDCSSVHINELKYGFEYIRKHTEIRDVIISGGDPLLLNDEQLEYILSNIRLIKHVEIIRIGTRAPVTLPQRVTPNLCKVLAKHHPLYINTHFNHPQEITAESCNACQMLANTGIPLGNQSVLLKGINDNPEVMKKLMQLLLTIRVKPYYIYQADLVRGTSHFRTPVQTGIYIIQKLRGHTSGMAVPHYVVDAPGGGGKIALIPDPIIQYSDKSILLRNYEGKIFSYPSNPLFYKELLTNRNIKTLKN